MTGQRMESLASVERQARERLHPGLTNPNWLVLRRRREIFNKWLSALPGTALDVLDVGGRIQPYRPLLQSRDRRYVALDLRQTPVISLVASAEHIPFATNTFDLVICTQVLEYIRDPAVVIQEIHRVLKPGGRLLLSAPAISICDAAEDRWRFFRTGLEDLLTPFAEKEIIPEGGSIIGFFRMVNSCLNVFVRYQLLRQVFLWTLCPVLNLCGELLDQVANSHNDQFTANYSVCARK